MENQNAALGWVISKTTAFNLTIERMAWINELLPAFSDVLCGITLKGRRYYGWGAGNGEDLALIKAVAECLERFAMTEAGSSNSNGYAAHLDAAAASNNAAAELIERDGFLSHFMTSTPFEKLDEAPGWPWLANVDDWMKKRRLSLRFYRLGPHGIQAVIDGRNTNRPFGYVMGAAVKARPEDAAISALIEAARSATYVMANDVQSLGLPQFKSLNKPDFDDHGRLALNLDYARSISFLFNSPPLAVPTRPIYLDATRVRTRSVYLNGFDIENCPFHFAQADAEIVQRLWLGECSSQNANLARLSEFAGRSLEFFELNPLPHPMS